MGVSWEFLKGGPRPLLHRELQGSHFQWVMMNSWESFCPLGQLHFHTCQGVSPRGSRLRRVFPEPGALDYRDWPNRARWSPGAGQRPQAGCWPEPLSRVHLCPQRPLSALTCLQGLLLLQQGHLLGQGLQLALELLKHLGAHDV